jgi:hypothetical protein
MGTEQKKTILMSDNPFFIKGPDDINPLNIATTRPVALTIRVSMEVKAKTRGVNSTPPPIPPMTATTAIAVLKKNEPVTILHIANELSTSVPDTRENTAIKIYPATVKTIRTVNSGTLFRTACILSSW